MEPCGELRTESRHLPCGFELVLMPSTNPAAIFFFLYEEFRSSGKLVWLIWSGLLGGENYLTKCVVHGWNSSLKLRISR